MRTRALLSSISRLVALSGLLTACVAASPVTQTGLRGEVRALPGWSVQASEAEVGTAATVSLIDPALGRTIATTLTRPDRSFSLALAGFRPQVRTYYLEAIKGLSSNQAAHDAVRLRTLVRWDGVRWQALTTGDASIGVSTTALAAIVALRAGASPVPPEALIGKLTLGAPDVFAADGTGVSPAEFDRVQALVLEALAGDRDPLEALAYDESRYALKLPAGVHPLFLAAVHPNPVAVDERLTLRGDGFQLPPERNAVSLNGLLLSVESGASTSLVVLVPSGATSGVLSVTAETGRATASLTVVPPAQGALFPDPAPEPTPTPGGTDVGGRVNP
ncbi:MAG TPA: hypothetical protein V6D00_00295 [Pantanalinema sp.]